MKHYYDLFERFPDGSSLWRACAIGVEGARHHMYELAKRSSNHFYAMNVVSGKIILPNPRPSPLMAAPAGKQSSAAVA
ncbi:MAG TPA: hypothetical protein VKV15_09640 [Bryobacteraceae bacterium]|nr:hypothetical protein [Bryobacteraceae bacterium]